MCFHTSLFFCVVKVNESKSYRVSGCNPHPKSVNKPNTIYTYISLSLIESNWWANIKSSLSISGMRHSLVHHISLSYPYCHCGRLLPTRRHTLLPTRDSADTRFCRHAILSIVSFCNIRVWVTAHTCKHGTLSRCTSHTLPCKILKSLPCLRFHVIYRAWSFVVFNPSVHQSM